jgi:hypothetical protein
LHKLFTMIARFIATLSAVLFVLTTIAALFLTTINRQVFNANTYKNALVEQNIYKSLPEIVAIAISSQTGAGGNGAGGTPSFTILTAEDWQAIVAALLPPDDLQSMAENTLDQVFAYLNGETGIVTVPLDKLKERLAGPASTALILQLINSRPACTEQYLAQLFSGTVNSSLILCKPPDLVVSLVVPLFQELLVTVAAELPDQVTIIKLQPAGALPSGSGPFGEDPITTIRIVRLMMRLSPPLPLAFLLLVTLFAVRSFKSLMRWWGIPIFVSGALAVVVGLLTLPLLNLSWTEYILPRIPSYIPANITSLGLELARSIFHTISEEIILQAVILLGFGLAAWVGSSFIKTKNEPDVLLPPPTQAP